MSSTTAPSSARSYSSTANPDGLFVEHCSWVMSSLSTLEELADVLDREKFDPYVTREEREEFLEGFIDRAVEIEPVEEVRACRDPKDDTFLELALAGQARCIVSIDRDLLDMGSFRGIPIMTPVGFLETTESEVGGAEA